MTTQQLARRRAAHVVAWLGTALAALGLVTQMAAALPAGTPPDAVTVLSPLSGDSDTDFEFTFPTETFITCPGDATENYRWTTFVTPIAQDPATLQFDGANFPIGADPTAPLIEADGTAVAARLPSIGSFAIGFSDVAFDFSAAPYNGFFTTGDYWLGIACTQPDGIEVNNVKYWATSVTITVGTGGSNGFTWEAAEVTVPTTDPTSTVDDTAAPTTSVGDTVAPTTTVDDSTSTTTTTAPSSGVTTTTSTATSGFGVSGTPAGGGPSTPTFSTGGSLPATGSSTAVMVVWAVLVLIFGRMAILLGREPKVIAGR